MKKDAAYRKKMAFKKYLRAQVGYSRPYPTRGKYIPAGPNKNTKQQYI